MYIERIVSTEPECDRDNEQNNALVPFAPLRNQYSDTNTSYPPIDAIGILIFGIMPPGVVMLSLWKSVPFEFSSRGNPVINPDFAALADLQSSLERVTEHTAKSSKVAVDIKDSEMALRDLTSLVKLSPIASKDVLTEELIKVTHTAKHTSRSLQKFGTRVWGAVDRIVSLNKRTIVVLEGASNGKGDIVRHREELEDFWFKSMELLERVLRDLVHEAEDKIAHLERLDEMLKTVEVMVTEEQNNIRGKEKVAKKQWFKDGEKLQNFDTSLGILQMVKDERKNALVHVEDTLSQLNRMSDHLGDLRERVAEPIIASSLNIPIEVHIDGMRYATERLVNGQNRMAEVEDEYRREKFSS
ncbi:hypothetical protein BN14_03273 [Rhizoctonia solani AG-1 IB]|uniref:Uncharacterized protein n=2 Tax=Rhizoctonia solani TaxID=456999 RepID=A0A8H2WP89_9AGAM|nr:unnamed protein product [Rhizoctonia solani]CCO29265.1 hypothetical protein BN14_03273 [Rhizoctonia solani AG-1 IB]